VKSGGQKLKENENLDAVDTIWLIFNLDRKKKSKKLTGNYYLALT
jgi:hypothetical protein